MNDEGQLERLWRDVLQLADSVVATHCASETTGLWPVLALIRRACVTMRSVRTLVEQEAWHDALSLCRNVIEVGFLVHWMLRESTPDRIREYMLGVADEQRRLRDKPKQQASGTAHLYSLLFENTVDDGPDRKRKSKTFRDMAREAGRENVYDIPYWQLSLITHGNAVSVLPYHPSPTESERAFLPLVSTTKGEMLQHLACYGIVCEFLHLLGAADVPLSLSMSSALELLWQQLRKALVEDSRRAGVELRLVEDIDPKAIRSIATDGTTFEVSPQGIKRVPLGTEHSLPMAAAASQVSSQSRNSRCVCGSGKKFKRCCGR